MSSIKEIKTVTVTGRGQICIPSIARLYTKFDCSEWATCNIPSVADIDQFGSEFILDMTREWNGKLLTLVRRGGH